MVTINGANENPSIDIVVANTDSAETTLSESNEAADELLAAGGLTSVTPAPAVTANGTNTGTLTVTDVDVSDQVSASVTGVVVSGTTDDSVTDAVDAYQDLLTLSPVNPVINGSSVEATLIWTFDENELAAVESQFDYLDAGEKVTLTYTITVTDDNNATDTHDVAITILGTDDEAEITAVNTINTTIVESADQPDGAPDADPVGASGSITFVSEPSEESTIVATVTRPDVADLDFVTGAGQVDIPDAVIQSWIDSFTLTNNASTGIESFSAITGEGVIEWSLDLDNADLEFLSENDVYQLEFVININDNGIAPDAMSGEPTTDDTTQTIVVTIQGTNDEPVVTGSVPAAALLEITEDELDFAPTGATPEQIANGGQTVLFTYTFDEVDLSNSFSTNVQATTDYTPSTNGGLPLILGNVLTPSIVTTVNPNEFTLNVNYDVDNAALQQLAEGETVTEIHTITIFDNPSATGQEPAILEVVFTGVNDAPILGADTLVNYPENDTDPVGTFVATDVDLIDTISYSLEGQDAAAFNISSDGELTFAFSPDFELPIDSDGDNVYQVTIVATDSSGVAATESDTQEVTVTVTDVAAAPVLIDLDGDGIEITETSFDFDNDGVAETGGFTNADDAILAIDVNGDGAVNGVTEIALADLTEEDDTDLEALGTLIDENGDGLVDANDSGFDSLLLWQDANQDGIAQEGEVSTLEEAGIASISTEYLDDSEAYTVEGLANVLGESEVTFTDGSTTVAADAELIYSDAAIDFSLLDNSDSPEIDDLDIALVAESAAPAQATASADQLAVDSTDAVDAADADLSADSVTSGGGSDWLI